MITVRESLRLAAALLFVGLAPRAQAFHSGGVAECEGCHSMHNSFEGSANVTGQPQYASGPYLLKARDQSGVCLNCHQAADTAPSGYHVSTAGVTPYDASSPVEMTPGGDFAWLKKTMTTTIRGTLGVNEGDRHGHNIVAIDFDYAADKLQRIAPGGTYPAAALACSSCHDPHGRYRRFANGSFGTTGLPIASSGSYFTSPEPTSATAVGAYRLLAGVGYQPKSLSGSYAFIANPMDALAPSSYNRTESSNVDRTQQIAVGYMGNSSEWCANCHASMHRDDYFSGTGGLVHPAGNGAKLTAPIVANYNAYLSSGVMTNPGLGYCTLVATEIGSVDYAGLKAYTGAWGATLGYTNVTCFSCHRAHASAFESIARYSLSNEFMTIADAAGAAMSDSSTTENKDTLGYDATQQQNAYYGRAAALFGPYARNLCNRCHAKD